MAMSGILIRLNYASFWPIYITLMTADLVGDTVWYGVGYHFARPLIEKFGNFFGLTPELIEKTRTIFQNHEKKILFTSKITFGLGFPLAVLVVAGMSKMPFKKYIGSLFLGQFIFTGMLISVGYFFGDFYVTLGKDFKLISMLAFFLVFIFALNGIRSYLKNKNWGKIN